MSRDNSVSRFQGLLFDVSGTLWNDLDQVFYANWGAVEELGFTKFPSTFGKFANEPLSLEGFKANAKGSCVEMFRSFGDLKDISDSELDNLYQEQLAISCRKHPVKLYEGIEELLQKIPLAIGVEKVGVISSHPKERLKEDFERLGISHYFGKIDGGVHYKSAAIEEDANKLRIDNNFEHLSNNVIAYIGDTKSDMLAANKAGAYALGVSYGYQSPCVLRQGKPKIVRASPQTLDTFLFPNS